jgi:Trk-type K+ transport system membrane component
MLPEKNEHQLLQDVVLENQRLLSENNQLLKKIRRISLFNFWFRLVMTLVFIGAPLVLYYYVIEPYFESMGSSFSVFQQGLQEIPGWKQFYEAAAGNGE